MFKNLLNSEVTVIVSTKADGFLEYSGMLVEEDNETITLKNVSISLGLFKIQKSVFGNMGSSYDQNIESVILNKQYIISCNKK